MSRRSRDTADAVRVLLVSAPTVPPPDWSGANGRRFELSVAGGVEEATLRLASLAADVVVLDATLAVAEADALPQLRQNLGDAGLLVRTEHYSRDLSRIMQRLDAGCLLPGTAPPPMQAQLIALAAERARLAAALRERAVELEQRTQELERSRSRFRDVIERNADAIVVVDREGIIRFANAMAAELFRSPREALFGTPFGFPVVLGETTELDLPHPGGTRVIEMRVVESEWEDRTAFIASLRDVTERKRAEEGERRLIREQAARAAAEAAARRFRFLAEATTRLSLPLDYAATLSTLANLCTTELCDCAIVYVAHEGGAVQRREVAHRDPALRAAIGSAATQPIDLQGQHPVFEALRTRSALLLAELDEQELARLADDESERVLIDRLGITSLMLVPLVARDRALGAIGLACTNPDRRFTEEDLTVASDLGLRAALALDNARLYREAQEANQAKSDLLAVISHDLRTPVNSIMGHAELLSLGIPEAVSEGGLERVERIRTSANHLLYLIEELLSFARLDGGREEIRLRQVDARDLIREVGAVFEPLALERGLALRLELPQAAVTLRTDPDRLRQILLNLVGNALKYTEAGEVRVELTPGEEGSALFRVVDTGIGIEQAHLERIFEPFWQADPAQRHRNGGTGLGLSVVRGLVRLLGGAIGVQSEVGRGSTFTVSLPLEGPEESSSR